MITRHPDWQLVEDLAARNDDLCQKAATLIRRLKADIRDLQNKNSRLEFPDTTGQ